MPMIRKQTVFIAEDKQDYVILTNGVMISKEDTDLLFYIYHMPTVQGYYRVRGNLGSWKQDAKLHKIIADRMGLNNTIVDHINNNKLDNRRTNLQDIDQRSNSTKDRKGTSQYKRVSFDKQARKWRVAFIVDSGKAEIFGKYKTEAEAAYWADVWAVRFLADPIMLNFPDNINFYLEEALLLNSIRPWQRTKPTPENLYDTASQTSI